MKQGTKVWDWPVRATHWLLVMAVLGAWWTGEHLEDWFVVHRACGVTALVLVLFRLGWGVFGTRTARFSSFLAGPSAVLQHLRDLFTRRLAAHAGHSASGGWAVLALWLAVLAQAGTGLFANDDVMNAGPLYGWVSGDLSEALTAWHHEIFDALLLLVLVHVGAVLVYRFWGQQNLVPAMLHGRRGDVPADEDIGPERVVRALIWLTVVSVAVGALLWFAPPAVLDAF
jgi:cytochrome b